MHCMSDSCVCQKCGRPISKTVNEYSIGHFSKPLCMDCQRHHRLMAVKGSNTFSDKGYYCNQCKKTISFDRYKFSKNMYNQALCQECENTRRNPPRYPKNSNNLRSLQGLDSYKRQLRRIK
jgi:hypothetical protein